jgi:RNA polymerase sigma-70 factor (ECF subfamily)
MSYCETGQPQFMLNRSTRLACDQQNGTKDKTLNKHQAFNQFFAQGEKRAFKMAQIATGNREEALDIVQDAMMMLVRKYADRTEDEWGALFYRIVQNRIKDWYRRQKVRNIFQSWFTSNEDDEEQGIESLPEMVSNDPFKKVSLHRMTDQLEQALGQLPLRQQQTFLLRAWEGLDVKKAAQALGISEGSIKTHYSRAVHSLRETLGEHQYEE